MKAKRTEYDLDEDERSQFTPPPYELRDERGAASTAAHAATNRFRPSEPQSAEAPQPAANEALAFGCLVVGRDAHFAGTLDVPGVLHVEGRVDATIKATEIKVLPGGTLVGEASCVEAQVHGTLKGGISCSERLAVLAGAIVEGDIHYFRDLCVESGAKLNCTLNFHPDPAPIQPAPLQPAAPILDSLADIRHRSPPGFPEDWREDKRELAREIAPLPASLMSRLFGSNKDN